MRKNYASNSPFEPVMGFSRVVRSGNNLYVSGTVAWDETGQSISGGDVYEQTKRAIENVGAALERAGASLEDVVRTRLYVTDASQWPAVARAHQEAFAAILPASTLVEVKGLASPAMLVEIEADAVLELP